MLVESIASCVSDSLAAEDFASIGDHQFSVGEHYLTTDHHLLDRLAAIEDQIGRGAELNGASLQLRHVVGVVYKTDIECRLGKAVCEFSVAIRLTYDGRNSLAEIGNR